MSIENDDQTDHADLAAFEQNVLATLDPDADNLPGDDGDDEGEIAPASSPAPAAPAPAPTAPAPAAKPEGDRGDLRAALRASRTAERGARDREALLQEEVTRLRAQAGDDGAPGPAAGDDDLQAALADLEREVPQAATVVRALAKKVDALASTQQQTAAAPAEPAFVPQVLPDALQDVVDTIPELLTWQTSREGQERWELAKATDAMLMKHPAWKDKPEAERLTEVVRKVHAELGSPAPSAPPAPGRTVKDIPTRGIETLSDLRGGGVPNSTQGPDYHRMKSDDEVMAALNRLAG